MSGSDDPDPGRAGCPAGRGSFLLAGPGHPGRHDEGMFEISDDEFEALIVRAIDRLPQQFRDVINQIPVVISDQGRERHAYGLYQGDGIARDNFPDRIIIFKDTLVRDFGHDPQLLADQVERTVRHELGHHLGYDEGGVAGLGL